MKTKATIVWDYKQGWTSPEIEVPPTGKIAIFVDYPDQYFGQFLSSQSTIRQE